MKVQTDFEVKHFVEYLQTNIVPVNMKILGREGEFHITKMNGEGFEVHEDALPLIQTKVPKLTITNKILH